MYNVCTCIKTTTNDKFQNPNELHVHVMNSNSVDRGSKTLTGHQST